MDILVWNSPDTLKIVISLDYQLSSVSLIVLLWSLGCDAHTGFVCDATGLECDSIVIEDHLTRPMYKNERVVIAYCVFEFQNLELIPKSVVLVVWIRSGGTQDFWSWDVGFYFLAVVLLQPVMGVSLYYVILLSHLIPEGGPPARTKDIHFSRVAIIESYWPGIFQCFLLNG